MTENEEPKDDMEELKVRFEIGEISEEEYERLSGAIPEEEILEVEPIIPTEHLTEQQPKSKRAQLLEKTLTTVAVITGLYFLSAYLKVPYLWIELIEPTLILLASQLIPILVERKEGSVIGCVLKGLSLALFVTILFNDKNLFLYSFNNLSNPLILMIVGITVHSVGKEVVVWTSLKQTPSIFSGVGVLVAGVALWKMTEAVNRVIIGRTTVLDIGTTFFAGFLAVAAAFFFSYSRYLKDPIVIALSNWFIESQLRTFLIGSFFGFYFFILRPTIVQAFSFAPLIEWSVVSLLILRILISTRSKISKTYAPLVDIASWERHVQKIRYKMDTSLEEMRNFQRLFVDEGIRDPLLVSLISILAKSGYSQTGIAYSLHDLINYRDKDVPQIAFDWEKKRVLKKNREARMNILNAVMESIKEDLAPIYLKETETKR